MSGKSPPRHIHKLLCVCRQIKFGVYSRKDKSKIFIFSSVINRNESAYHLPYVSYTERCKQLIVT